MNWKADKTVTDVAPVARFRRVRQMAGTASTFQQVVLLVLFVLPGISYQFVRERKRGPVPGERDLSECVLRAITASIALDAV